MNIKYENEHCERLDMKVPTPSGEREVPALRYKKAKGLCVTMCQFGEFEVTHERSGRRLIGGYERAASATAIMLRFYIAMKEAGIDPELDMDDIQAAVRSSKEKHEVLSDNSIIEYIALHNQCFTFGGEFPWESFDESPFGDIEFLIESIEESKGQSNEPN